MPPRCCSPPTDEFAPCYASALAYPAPGQLRAAVTALERDEPLVSCFTAWCPRCRGNYLLTPDLAAFPSPSAHHVHKLRLLDRLRAEGIYLPAPCTSGVDSSLPQLAKSGAESSI
jgi:hypothetical protein